MSEHDSPFVPGPGIRVSGATDGPLKGLSFAAKDLFDVAGYSTGGGNPDWNPNASIPGEHAWAVAQLLDSGADLIGKTITDEVSLGILGENAFYGTPGNPNAPGRVPGGSSSGSASAVASRLCDTALGTDTGGSVRVPASFCGLYGIRPTHGRLDLTGMLPQAPSSDTTGWFARDATTFGKVSSVLLSEAPATDLPNKLLIAIDAFGLAEETVQQALQPLVDRLTQLIGSASEVSMAPPGLSTWARAQRTLQPYEAWQTFKPWLDRTNPRMAYSVARNLALAESIPAVDRQWAALMREEARARMRYLLGGDSILCLPTTPFPAPRRGLSNSDQAPLRDRITCLCCHGGLTGACQISIPGATVGGLPVGLSLVGAPGRDSLLIGVALALEEAQR